MQIVLYYIAYYKQYLNGLTERVKFFSGNAKKEEISVEFYQHYCLDKTSLLS